jgi:hypothetical protein
MKYVQTFCWKPEEKRQLGTHMVSWEEDIKMDLKEVGLEGLIVFI